MRDRRPWGILEFVSDSEYLDNLSAMGQTTHCNAGGKVVQTARRQMCWTKCWLFLCGVLGLYPNDAQCAERPNIVLIMADDFGFELLSAYGGESFDTPVLDKLARDGVVFNYCFACPLCTPTRVSIMTGKYNHRNYRQFGSFPRQDEERTFGNLLKDAGYATCIAGKWQLGNASPKKMGFEASMQCDSWGGYWVPGNIRVNEQKLPPGEPRYRPDIVCDFALDFVRGQAEGDRPFFLYWPMFLTHHPEEPSPDHPNKQLIEECKRGEPNRDEYVFPDMVTYMDKLIGRLVDTLDETGTRNNTMILFLGDNGTCGGHPPVIRNGKRFRSGGKGSMKDLGTRVPLIVNWRGVTRGMSCDDLVDITDFYATFADAAGVSVPPTAGVDGHSFFPRIAGKRPSPRETAFVLFDRNDTVKWRSCVRNGTRPNDDQLHGSFWARTVRWKLYGDGRLYDMEDDPFEEHALAAATDTEEAANARSQLATVFERLEISQNDLITFDEYKRLVESGRFVREK